MTIRGLGNRRRGATADGGAPRRRWRGLGSVLAAGMIALLVALQLPSTPLPAVTKVACTLSAVACENQLPGNPASEWDVDNGGDPSIVGFTTDISANVGSTVQFKINTSARAYSIDIYRMGYYQGNGARKITSVSPSVSLPQTQPGSSMVRATSIPTPTWVLRSNMEPAP